MTGTEQWLGGAALVGVLAAFWQKIKLLSWRLVNLLIVRARLEDQTARAVAYYCWSEMRRTPFGEKHFKGANDFVQPLDRYQILAYETIGWDPLIFWQGWRPLLISLGTQALEGGGNTGTTTTITFIRGLFDLDQLIIKAVDKLNQVFHSGDQGSRYYVRRVFGMGGRRNWGSGEKAVRSPRDYGEAKEADASTEPDRRYLKWQRHEIGMPRGSNNPFDCLAFPVSVLDAVERCRRWLASEKWYKEKEIPWRLGLLLYGPPGTGKTSFVKAIGRLLNLPVISYDLASFSNQDFEHEWQNMMSSTPCIALLEDVDAVFDGRENRLGEEGGGLTFDCLLNCIGGIKDANGVLVFVTTNRPECLDDALGKPDGNKGVSTRPGRIDLAVELGVLDQACRQKLAQRILADCPEKIDELVQQGDGYTGAQFTELCAKAALEHYWSEGGPNENTNGKGPLGYRRERLANTYEGLYEKKQRKVLYPPSQILGD